MLYEFFVGMPPFNDDTPELIFQRILIRDIQWESVIPLAARDLIDKLLAVNPVERLGHNGSSEVRNHPFFASINWTTIRTESREDTFVPKPVDEYDTGYFTGLVELF